MDITPAILTKFVVAILHWVDKFREISIEYGQPLILEKIKQLMEVGWWGMILTNMTAKEVQGGLM